MDWGGEVLSSHAATLQSLDSDRNVPRDFGAQALRCIGSGLTAPEAKNDRLD